ncbi:MAG TPA: thiolase family protein [Acidimicrobiia bacterium]|nr:thiolase family protein [Acidimicrobiia bacterium]
MSGGTGIVVAGVGLEPFVGRSDDPVDVLGRRALLAALADAGIDLEEVGLFAFGSRFAHPGVGQRVLVPLGPTGATVINTENACASGSVALEIATAYVRAGMAEVAVAVGVERASELGSSVPLPEWDRLGRAGISHPVRYALEASRYCAAAGTEPEALAAVAVKNRAHAVHNPAARFRTAVTLEEVLASPPVAEPFTRLQCCANADGAAAVVVTTPERARTLDAAEPVRLLALAVGSGQRADRVPDPPITARLAARAFAEAGLSPDDIDVAEVYDAFTVLEVLGLEALGFAAPGTAAKRVAAGEFALGAGGLVVNPGGGLLGRGHPLGATGLAQFVEIVDQLRGRAGDRQVNGARVGLVQTLGGNVRDLEANAAAVAVLAP